MSFKASGPKTRPDRVKPIPRPFSATAPLKQETLESLFPSKDQRRQSRRSSASSTSSSISFHSAHSQSRVHPHPPTSTSAQASEFKASPPPSPAPRSRKTARFTEKEEAALLAKSHTLKTQANSQFSAGDYSSAISTYDRALAECPIYLDYEVAVLQSNVAACRIKLEDWKDAIDAAERGLDGLATLIPLTTSKGAEKSGSKDKVEKDGGGTEGDDKDGEVIELPDDNDEAADQAILKKLEIDDQKKADVHRIRTKLLLRRARARFMLGTTPPKPKSKTTDINDNDAIDNLFTRKSSSSASHDNSDPGSAWSNLTHAQTDYQLLSTPAFFSTLPASDKKTVTSAMAQLPRLVEEAKTKEVGEMMGKLKELGNGILKPFGLSTDMFKFDDDGKGGMSMRFDGQGGK